MEKLHIIEALSLEPHIEGGYFRRTYYSQQSFETASGQQRNIVSSIFYLLTDDSPIGFFHRNQSDIVHYWQLGSALTYFLISPEGQLTTVKLGPDLDQGEQLQLTVPSGYWKATQLTAGEFGLLSEAVAPGFDYDDMTIANKKELSHLFRELWQQHEKILSPLCKS